MKYIYKELRLKKTSTTTQSTSKYSEQVLSLNKQVVIFEYLMLMVLARKLA